ncbi:phage tail protein [Desulfovibrio falkowii]|uniref:Phage tail collar domain-containing protein n=1 Tax=Desulfovibrio falkowii TaxID=3136602 RepID=A0ABQ0EC61_9BACT
MQKNRAYPLILFFFLLLAFQPALGADSTSFDPTKVAVKAKGSGGVPVGTIISWPVATNPDDMDNWLECNGQSISQSVYPELFAVVGPQVPDLRGLFLRGLGGNSAALGVQQGDAIRNITGTFGGHAIGWKGGWGSGPFYSWNSGDRGSGGNGQGTSWGFDASRVVPTADENRPVNTAVRYLMRARL